MQINAEKCKRVEMYFLIKVYLLFLFIWAIIYLIDFLFRLPLIIKDLLKEPPAMWLIFIFGLCWLYLCSKGSYKD